MFAFGRGNKKLLLSLPLQINYFARQLNVCGVLSRDKKLGKTKHYLCGEDEDSGFFKLPAAGWGAFLVELGGNFGCESFLLDFFLLTANQIVVGWFMTRQSLTTVYAIR